MRRSVSADSARHAASWPSKFALLPMSYLFKAGHRIRLTLSFSDPTGAAPQSVTVHEGGNSASQIRLPIAAK